MLTLWTCLTLCWYGITDSAYMSEQTLGDSEGQGSLACYSPWACRVGHDLVPEQQQQLLMWIRLDGQRAAVTGEAESPTVHMIRQIILISLSFSTDSELVTGIKALLMIKTQEWWEQGILVLQLQVVHTDALSPSPPFWGTAFWDIILIPYSQPI